VFRIVCAQAPSRARFFGRFGFGAALPGWGMA
jgi:hypothetical protein